MNAARSVFGLLAPDPTVPALAGAEKAVATITALLWALACSAAWGAIVGLASHHALRDAILAPVLLVSSAIAAVPLTLFVARTVGSGPPSANLLLAYATGSLAGAVALLLLSPLVALYQHSSALMMGLVGPASAMVGILFGTFIFARVLGKLAGSPEARRGGLFCMLLMFTLQGLAMVQLASVMPPFFEKRTTIGHGIDALGDREAP